MNKKDLYELGIDEEIAQQIIVLHGKDIENHKSELETRKSELEALSKQLEEANKTIESFKAMDIDAIKAAADEWKSKAEQAQQEAEQKVKAVQFEHALQDRLRAEKARNIKAVRALLDMDKIKLSEDGTILEGLDDQLTAVKSENEFLFDSEKEPEEDKEEEDEESNLPTIVKKTANDGILADTVIAAARGAAGLPNV